MRYKLKKMTEGEVRELSLKDTVGDPILSFDNGKFSDYSEGNATRVEATWSGDCTNNDYYLTGKYTIHVLEDGLWKELWMNFHNKVDAISCMRGLRFFYKKAMVVQEIYKAPEEPLDDEEDPEAAWMRKHGQ